MNLTSEIGKSDIPPEYTVSEIQESPSKSTRKKGSVLDLSWLSSSEDDAFYQDLIVSTSQKSSMKPPSLRRQIFSSSPTLERVMKPEFLAPSLTDPNVDLREASYRKLKRIKFSPTRNDLSDPISTSSVDSSPPRHVDKMKPTAAVKNRTHHRDGFSEKEWREANKLSRKRDDILKEMIVDIALCIEDKIMTDHFKECFELPTVRRTYLEIPLISWKRRISASYNAEQDVFVPCEMKEISERVLALYYTAEDLVEKIQNKSLEMHISTAFRRARTEDPLLDYHLVVIVPGFKEYIRKLQSAEDKIYREQMLEKMKETTSRRKIEQRPTITASEAQKLLYLTEVRLGVNIFLTRSIDETIDWLLSFTYTIGNSLYDKHERNPEFANFGKAKLGTDRKSTFVEMMKKFNLMSNMKAEKLFEFYTSPVSIYKRLSEKENLGTVNGKTIVPPTVNNAMKRFFTATDPSQVIND